MKTTYCAVLTCLLLAGSLSAAPVALTDGVWTSFFWADLGPIDDPADGFMATVPAGFVGLLRVVDCCIIGDRFDVFGNPGGLLFSTSAINPADDGVDSGASTGDDAWIDAMLSKGSILLASGTSIEVDINVTRLASGFSTGEGFIRLDLEQQEEVIPETGTLALLGTGLALLFLGRRRFLRAC